MRVLFLNNFYYLRGGSERVLFEEMRMLREAGHEVAVYSRTHEKNEPSEFSAFFPPPLDTGRLTVSLRSLRSVGELVYSRPARKGLEEVISRFRPEIAHAHNIYGHLSTSVLDVLKEQNIPVVLTLHDFKYICPSYLMLDHGMVCEQCRGGRYHRAVMAGCHKNSRLASAVYAFETWFNDVFGKYGSVACFIAPSRFLRDKVIHFGKDPGTIVHIPNCIETRDRAILPDPGCYSLFFGRLSKEKGVATLLQALKGMPIRTGLVIAGDGPDRTRLESMARKHSLPVTFTGHLSGRALERTIAGSRVVIVPSEWYENAPLSILEAFACSKPVIGARIGGIPEMIDEGKNGYLFEPGNAADLRRHWSACMQMQREQVCAMGANARRKAEEHYSEKNHSARLIDLYLRVLLTRRAGEQGTLYGTAAEPQEACCHKEHS